MTEPPQSPIHPLDWSLLDLDPLNPRLVDPSTGGKPLDQAAAATKLLDKHDPLPIGRSMAEFGFFQSDPLIAFEENGRFVVVEGNRRLLAVRLLLDAAVRDAVLADDEWADLADGLSDERRADLGRVPVQVVDDRDAAAPVIGFRHIVGIKKWDAYEKAAFVSRLVQSKAATLGGAPDEKVFQTVSVLTGESPTRIRTYVRDYTLLRQAETAGVDVKAARQEFGVFTRALSSGGIRSFLQAAGAGDVTVGMTRAYDAEDEQMSELLGWVYGDANGEPVFSDARRLRDLGRVLESPDATEHLRRTRNLDEAEALSEAVRDRVLTNGTKALAAVRAMLNDLDKLDRDQAVENVISQIAVAVAAMNPLPAPSSAAAADPTPADDDDYDLTTVDETVVDDDDDGR